MNDPGTSGDLIRKLFEPSQGGVVGLVDDLLMSCRGRQLRLDFQEGFCRIRPLGDDMRDSADAPLPKSVFRAMLARIAVLCNERNPDSVTPYGAEGELTIRSDPTAVFRVEFTNTPAEQRPELRSSIGPTVESGPIRTGANGNLAVAIEASH